MNRTFSSERLATMRAAAESYEAPKVTTEIQAKEAILKYAPIDAYSPTEAAEKLNAAQDYFRLMPNSQGVKCVPITTKQDIPWVYIDRNPKTDDLQTKETPAVEYDEIERFAQDRMK